MNKTETNKNDSEIMAVKPKKKRKPLWTTATIASEIGREELLAATFKEIIFHLISLVFLSIYIFSQIHSSEYYLTNALKGAFNVEEKLGGVSSASDLWDYLMGPMEEAFYGSEALEEYNEAKNTNNTSNITDVEALKNTTQSLTDQTAILISDENRVLGVPRIRQVKVTNSSCEIHGYFRRLFLACYNKFSTRWEDRKPFGLESPSAWTYSDSTETKSLPFRGTLTVYSGGGFYVDLADNLKETMAILEMLKDSLWITRGTRAVFVDFSVYNANLNLFCICKFVFEFLPTGSVVPAFRFSPATLTPFGGMGDWILRILLYLFVLYVLFSLMEELREMVYFKGSYFQQFWNYIDIIVIQLTCLLVASTEYMRFTVKAYINKIIENPHLYGNLETPGLVYTVVRITGATLLFFVYLRTFKFLNFNKRMGQLNDTIKKCSKDIVGFSVMFFVAYFAYAELGYLVFGSQVNGFRSFGEAMFTLLRAILGDFDYNEIRAANWFVAPIYFLSYIFLVFFVLLNMFLAIINDTYGDVKTDIAIAPKEMEMTEYLSRGFYDLLKKLGFKIKREAVQEKVVNTNLVKIRDALVKCNFDDREIQMYFTRYDIDPLEDLKRAEVEKFFDKFTQEDLNRRAAQDNVVTWKDFQKQDDKLVELENSVVMLGQRVHELLKSIENIQGGRGRLQ